MAFPARSNWPTIKSEVTSLTVSKATSVPTVVTSAVVVRNEPRSVVVVKLVASGLPMDETNPPTGFTDVAKFPEMVVWVEKLEKVVPSVSPFPVASFGVSKPQAERKKRMQHIPILLIFAPVLIVSFSSGNSG